MNKSINYFEQYDKHLVIFDFDETICQTNAEVRIENKKLDIKKTITATEYSSWRATKQYEISPEDWEIDFSEFRCYPSKGYPIKNVIDKLMWYATKDQYIVALVTGRDNLIGPKIFMQNNYIPIEKMILMCSGDPDKRNCYRSLIHTFEPRHVTVYEDSIECIKQCREICVKFEIPFSGVLVKNENLIYNWDS